MKTKKTIKEELEEIFSKETIEKNSLSKLVGGNDVDGINTLCLPQDQPCKSNCIIHCGCIQTNCFVNCSNCKC